MKSIKTPEPTRVAIEIILSMIADISALGSLCAYTVCAVIRGYSRNVVVANVAFFSFSSFNNPTVISRFDVATGEVEVFKAPDVAMNPADYIVKQVFYSSKDGTRVPMFI